MNTPEKDNSQGTFASNLDNIVKTLVLGSLPVIKNFLKQDDNLDETSKSQIEDNSFLKELLSKIFEKNPPNSKIHNSLLELTKDFKHSAKISGYLSKIKNFYYTPLVSICHLAISFLNLVNSIKHLVMKKNFLKKIKKFVQENYPKYILTF